MHSRLRLFAPWLIIALLFSNIATAAMWCCQSGGHHQQVTERSPEQRHPGHLGHAEHSMDQAQTTTSAAASDHQADCPLCASGCHSALVLPLAKITDVDPVVGSLVIQEDSGSVSSLPQSRYRPPIA
ncbi:hypothetical protein [Rheinheimera sp.]|uniref:hypothetical protein n=1 Tax=Rheinheimera sp. TaxID=1869214 RepID=UPI00307E2339